MIRVSLLLFLFYLVTCAKAQRRVDSLQYLLTTDMAPEVRVDALTELGRYYVVADLQLAGQYAHEALNLSLVIGYKRGAGVSYRLLSSIQARYENYSLSTKYIQKALFYFDLDNDSLGIGSSFITIGNAITLQGDFKLANRYHKTAVQIFRKLKNAERLGIALSNLGESYFYNNLFDSAEIAVRESLRYLDSSKNLNPSITCYSILGGIYLQRKDFTTAAGYLVKGLRLIAEQGDRSGRIATINTYMYLAEVYEKNHNFKEQARVLEKAWGLAQEYRRYNFLNHIALERASVEAQRSDFAKAYEILKSNTILQDSFYKINSNLKSQSFENLLKVSEVEVKNEGLIVEKELRNKVIVWMSFSCAVLLLLVVYFWFTMQHRKKTSRMLYSQSLEIEDKNKRLDAALNEKNRKLASHALYIANVNSLLRQIDLSLDDPFKARKFIRDLIKEENNWNTLSLHFSDVHPDFFKKLISIAPSLTQNELKHCAYLQLMLRTKEVAHMLNISVRSVEMSRYRIKKKLNLAEEKNLMEFLKML